MNRNIRAMAVALATACAIAAGGAGYVRAQAQSADDDTGLWFIELTGSVNAFRGQAQAAGIVYSERFAYTRIWNGVSVQSSSEAASLLGRLSSVRAVYTVLNVDIGPVEPANP